MALRLLGVLALAGILPVQGQPYELVMTGFCDAKSFLDGLVFRIMGRTASGAPWYKAVDEDQYIYWDPDCAGSLDGTARWVVDSDRPSEEAERDLDGDGVCNYHARINSRDQSRPPTAGVWTMECRDGWRSKMVMILEVTSTTTTRTTVTSTSTWTSTSTRTPTTTSLTSSSTATTTTTTWTTTMTKTSTRTTSSPCTEEEPAVPPPGATKNVSNASQAQLNDTAPAEDVERFVLTGACEYKGYLNGLTFEHLGETGEGVPYYKAHGQEEYLYHDSNCDGKRSPPRWVLDKDRPVIEPGRGSDLDDDGRCDYSARLDTAAAPAERPPTRATWRMYCGRVAGWQDLLLTLTRVSSVQPTPPCPRCKPHAWSWGETSTTTPRAAAMFLSSTRRSASLVLAPLLTVLVVSLAW